MKTVDNELAQQATPNVLPVIPTMDVVVFPHMIVPLLVLDERIINGINQALEGSKLVFLLATKKKQDDQDAIGTQDLYNVGTVASIMRLIKIPEGGIKILVQGVYKARTEEIVTHEEMLCASVEELTFEQQTNDPEVAGRIKEIQEIAEKMAASGQSFSPDFHIILSKINDPDKIADFILSHLNLEVEQAQRLLETTTQREFLTGVYEQLSHEMEIAQVQERIRNHARESMNKSQKEYYLREQLKAIKKELGEDDLQDIEDMREKLAAAEVSEEVRTEAIRQINRLERMSPESMEATVTRNYLDWLLALPWGQYTQDNLDIKHARQILEEDHYGLKDIKERILDFISIRNLKRDGDTPILCFAGPPGTGKTSLGKSIARSLGRKFVRISLGGVKDEAEIRGHRRTYVGAMPGRFIQAIRKAGSCNPVMVVDEIDKLGADFRGDPSAAMLEVLDPQQNKTFYDNFLGVPFDLSQVIFIATANNTDIISDPLRDRMEIIRLSGYTLDEKVNISKQNLVKRAIVDSGLEQHNPEFSDDVLKEIVMSYTREAGVRQLERTIRKLCSKAARILVEENRLISFCEKSLATYLGPPKFIEDGANRHDEIGISNGLAWTSYGGEMIRIEAVLMPGKGKLILTGQLGSVMQESAQAALSYARSHAKEFSVSERIFTTHDLHIHVPAGAVPKDGPSAGITMLSAILSVLTKRPISARYAMTGEVDLHGNVMPIGGVKEKILAAKRNGISQIIIPHRNKNDLIELDETVTKDIDIILVEHVDQVLDRVLVPHIPKTKSR